MAGVMTWVRAVAVALVAAGGASVAASAIAWSAPPKVPAPVRADVGGCSAKTPAPCEAACFKGDGAACAIVGAALEGMANVPVRLPQDLPRGRKALDKGCQLGNAAACRVLIDYDYEVVPSGTSCAGWEAICKRGDLKSCTALGQCLDHDPNFRRDKAQAVKLFTDGCARGEPNACVQLAFKYRSGGEVPKDLRRAFELFDQACRMDAPYACGFVGLMLEYGDGAPRDVAGAKAHYRMACARGIRPIPCEGLRRLGETPPSTTVSSRDATESNHVSTRFGYEWRIPANWQFVTPASVQLSKFPDGVEVVSARTRGKASGDSLLIAVRERTTYVVGKQEDDDPAVLDLLEKDGVAQMAALGLTKVSSGRTDFMGLAGVRIDGRIERPGKRFVTFVLGCKDRRQFEWRCISQRPQPNMPCRDAFGALDVHEAAP